MVENEYNHLYFEFKNKNIKKGNDLLSMIKDRTQTLMIVLFDFLSNKI